MVDTNNRWTYEGSLTTPPCSNSVFWNVVRMAYPISKKHMEQFVNQQKRQKGYDLVKTGMHREVQKVDDQEIIFVHDEEEDSRGIIIVVLGILLIQMTIVMLVCCVRAQKFKKQLNGEMSTVKPDGSV